MTYDELVDAAKKLNTHFPESGIITRGDMLGSLDQWRKSQTFYRNLITDYEG